VLGADLLIGDRTPLEIRCIMDVIAGMLMIWVGWAIYVTVFIGLGSFLLRILTPEGTEWDFSAAFWSGFVTLITFLQVTNLFAGIGPTTTGCFIAIGVGGYFLHRSRFAPMVFRGFLRWHLLLLVLALFWLSNRALQAPLLDDSGIYHFSSIRFANDFPLPPGLGNLHGHLAFNQSYFLFVAFLNNFPRVGYGHNFANSLLFAAAIMTIFWKGETFPNLVSVNFEQDKSSCFQVLLRSLMPITLFYLATCNRSNPPLISSPSPDAAIFILEIVLIAFLLELFARPDDSEIDRARQLTVLVCLAFALITLKLSSVGFVGATLALALLLAFHRRDAFRSIKGIPLLIMVSALIMIWVLRSVIASGYLIYPLIGTGVPVDWKVPEHLVNDERLAIWAWARLPVYQSWRIIGSWDWIPQWLWRMADRPDVLAPFGLIFIFLLCWFISGGRTFRRIDSSVRPLSGLLGVGVVSLVFWFWNAPDPRFLGASLWLVVLWAAGTTIYLSAPEKRLHLSRVILCSFWIIVVLAFIRNGPAVTTFTGGRLAQAIPTASLVPRTTRSGLMVYTPLPGGYCWSGSLPCTPFFRPQLKLRGKSMVQGFYLDESRDQAPDF
jgi:hypothetical protein